MTRSKRTPRKAVSLGEITRMCPGAAEYFSDQPEPAMFRVSVSDCGRPGYDPRSLHGVVYGVCNDSTTFCQFLVQVPRDMIVQAQATLISQECDYYWETRFYSQWPSSHTRPHKIACGFKVRTLYLSNTAQMYLMHYSNPTLQMKFRAVQHRLKVVLQSNVSGYITPVVQDGLSLGKMKVRGTLAVPHGQFIMISFQHFQMHSCFVENIQMKWKDINTTRCEQKIIIRRDDKIETNIYQTTLLDILFLLFSFRDDICSEMLFSFQPKDRIPQHLSSGLYNCSVGDYWRFQRHLDCNLKVECEDGRDEAGHCPYSSPACQGWVASGGKCYTFVSKRKIKAFKSEEQNFFLKAVQYCASLKAVIGQPKTEGDVQSIESALQRPSRSPIKAIAVGLFYGGLSVPNMYMGSVIAYDKTVLHYTINRRLGVRVHTEGNACLRPLHKFDLHIFSCSNAEAVVCEVTVNNTDIHNDRLEVITLPSVSRTPGKQEGITSCPNGQFTHTFLLDDRYNVCRDEIASPCSSSRCVLSNRDRFYGKIERIASFDVFTCEDDTKLSYTLVCDLRRDCQDGSDESFCQHPPCNAFTCTNSGCVSYSKVCDRVSDCKDDSDEMMCAEYTEMNAFLPSFRSPVLVRFDSVNTFTLRNMSSDEACPDTHYRCPGRYNDCLPVYTRCNGWYDCLGHEDEEGCENMTCAGFYRCLKSTVCVHVDNLCDGWPHCPQRDDEWVCNMTCPAQCLCQGHAFLCPRPFSAHLFPQLRYVDAGGSGMTPSNLNDNKYIVHLGLSQCLLTSLSTMTLRNLQFLDLSANRLVVVNMFVFVGLVNLKTLILARNPIHLLRSDPASAVQQSALRTIDMSHTNITVFDSRPLSNFVLVKNLNLSYSPTHTISPSGFRYVPRLTHLYMEGIPVQRFPADILKPLSYLRTVTSHTYKLCCKEILPNHFELISCDAPRDEISSCEDLLQSVTYRGFLWMIGFLSLLGNFLCFVARVCLQRGVSSSGFHVFVTNLSMADLLMGVYIAIIGVADELFHGEYLFREYEWTHSVACKVAGFLSLLSCEVSALIIFLITLDRFIVLHFPFSSVRFQRTSAYLACVFTWLIGWLLASIPLLPSVSHWEFFSQTGICIPLPVTRQDFEGKVYSVTVFIILNFVLFTLIATGQAFIYWSVQKNALQTDSTKTSRDLTVARRLISVAVTDFLCWFPIGLCGLLALADTPIPSEVNVGLAVFVLPLNSALNPFMYTFNMLREKGRKRKEAMLLKWLEDHADLLDN